MKMYRKSLIALGLFLGITFQGNSATNRTWVAPNPGLWTATTNWVGGVVPANLDALVFPAWATNGTATYFLSTNDFSAPTTNYLYVTGTNVQLYGTNIMRSSGLVVSNSGNNNVVGFPVTLIGPALYTNWNNTISNRGVWNLNSNTLVVGARAGTIRFMAAITNYGGLVVVGGGTVNMNAGGQDWRGDTLVTNGGKLQFSSDNAMPFGPGRGNLILAPGAAGSNVWVDINARASLTVNGIIGQGYITNGSTTSKGTLNLGSNDWSGQVDAIFAVGAKAPLNVTKVGAGTVSLNKPSPNNGDYRAALGTLILNHQEAISNAILNLSATNNGYVVYGSGIVQPVIGAISGTKDFGLTNQAGTMFSTVYLNMATNWLPTNITISANWTNPAIAGTNAYSGALIGDRVAVVKNGANAQILSGANTFTGDITVNKGKLVLGTANQGNNNITVATGATLGVLVSGAGQTLVLNSLTLGADVTNEFQLATFGNNGSTPIIYAARLNVNGPVHLNLSGFGLSRGDNALLHWDTCNTDPLSLQFVVNSLPLGVAGDFWVDPDNNILYLTITKAPSLRWTGAADSGTVGAWDIGLNNNWVDADSGDAAIYLDGMSVLFPDGAATNIITLSTSVAPYSITINNTQPYAFQTSYMMVSTNTNYFTIMGNGSLTKDGPGYFTNAISTNSYTGPTTIKQGTFVLGANEVIPDGLAAGSVTNAGGTLELNGFNETINGYYADASSAVDNSRTTQSTLRIYSNSVVNGVIKGNVRLFNGAAGAANALVLNSANTYTGVTTNIGGALILGNDNALSTTRIDLGTGLGLASLDATPRTLANDLMVVGNIQLGSAGTGPLTFNGPVNFFSSSNIPTSTRTITNLVDVVFNNVVTNGGVTKYGPARMTFNGNILNSTNFVVREGELVLSGTCRMTNTGYFLRPDCNVSNSFSRVVVAAGAYAELDRVSANINVGYDGGVTNSVSTNYFDLAGTVAMPFADSGSGRIMLGRSNSPAIFNLLAGGSVAVRYIATDAGFGTPGYTEFNADGGTLTAITNMLTFMQGISNTFIKDGGLTLDTAGHDITIAQSLLAKGAGGIVKNGNGVLTLSGTNNTYTGATLVRQGMLCLPVTQVGASPISVSSGAALRADVNVFPGTLTLPALTMESGTVLEIRGALSATQPAIQVTGADACAFSGSVVVDVYGFNDAPGSYPLIKYNNSLGGNGAGALSLVVPRNLAGLAHLENNAATSTINLVIDEGAVSTIYWNGDKSTNWDIALTSNWLLDGSATYFTNGDHVTFDDSAVSKTINVASNVYPNAINFVNTAGNDYVVSGPGRISGGASLTKNGNGVLTVATTNDYQGVTTLNAGILKVKSATALGTTNGATFINYGAELQIDGQYTILDAMTIVGTGPSTNGAIWLSRTALGTATLGGPITLAGNARINADTNSLYITNGVNAAGYVLSLGGSNNMVIGNTGLTSPGISGAGASVIKDGSGGLYLRANSSFDGGMTMNGGTIVVDSNYPSMFGSGPLTLLAGTLRANTTTPAGDRTINNDVNLTGDVALGSTVQTGSLLFSNGVWRLVNSNRTLTVFSDVAAYGPVTDENNNFALIKSGTGLFALANDNNNLSGGVFITNNGGALGIGYYTPSGKYMGNITNNGELRFMRSDTYEFSDVIGSLTNGSSSSIVSVAGGGTMNFSSGLLLFTQANFRVGINGGGDGNFVQSGGSIMGLLPTTTNAPAFAVGYGNAGGTATFNGSGVSDYFSSISIKVAPQPTNATNQSIMNVQNGLITSPSAIVGSGNDINHKAILNVSGGVLNLTGVGGDNGIEIARWRSTFETNAWGQFNLSGGLVNAYQVAFGFTSTIVTQQTIGGYGEFNMTGNGTLYLGAGGLNKLPSFQSPYVVNLGGGRIMAAADWSSPLNLNLTNSGNGIYFMAEDTNGVAHNITLSGNLTGTGGLYKNGAGTLLLTGTNAYAGQTVINKGTLVMNGISGPGAGLYEVSGGELAGFGSILDGVQVEAGSTLTIGAAGVFWTSTFGGVKLADGAVLNVDLNSAPTVGGGVNDLVQTTDLNLADGSGAVIVKFNLAAAPAIGQRYTLIKYTGVKTGSAANLVAAGIRYDATFYDDIPGQIDVVFSGAAPALVWQGDGSSNLWLTNLPGQWLSGSTPDVFFNGDSVTFDDSSANVLVNLSGSLMPGSVTVDTTNRYVFAGSGALAGVSDLTKNGLGSLVLAANNNFIGKVSVNQGTLVLSNANALGATNGITLVANGATLDLGGQTNLAAEPITLQGAGFGGLGALYNSAANADGGLRVTVASNAVVNLQKRLLVDGDRGGFWKMAAPGLKLTKFGADELALQNVGDTAFSDVDITQGTLTLSLNVTLGNATNIVTIDPGATLQFGGWTNRTAAKSKNIVMTNGTLGSVAVNGAGDSFFAGPISINESTALNPTNFLSVGTGATNTLLGPITGTGMLAKTGAGMLALSGTNTYVGDLLVKGGLLIVSNKAVLTAQNLGVGVDGTTGAVQVATGGTFNFGGTTSNYLYVGYRGLGTLGGYGSLDLSALPSCTATLGLVRVGVDEGPNNTGNVNGTLKLATNNTLTVAGGFVIADNKNTGNGTALSSVEFGQGNNVVVTPGFTNGYRKANGLVTIRSGGTLTLNNGALRTEMAVGVNDVSTGSIITNTVDLTGGAFVANLDNLIVGRKSGGGSGTSLASMTLGNSAANNVNVNSVTVGYISGGTNVNNYGIGALTVGGGQFVVNSNITLATLSGTNGLTTGTLNIQGGSFWVNGSILDGGGASTTLVSTATLMVGGTLGTPAAPLDSLQLSNATLALPVTGTATNIVAVDFQPHLGATNTIAILQLPVVGTLPARFTLIKYGNSIAGGVTNFGLAATPRVFGYLSNNIANNSLDLVITNSVNGLALDAVTWSGTAGNTWDINTTPNWLDLNLAAANYLQPGVPGDAVVFDDSAAGTTDVSLAGNLAPASIVVSNETKAYSFSGGKLTGFAALVKQGAGSLTLNNSGNTYTGPTRIGGGTLVVGAANALPTSTAVVLSNVAGAGLTLNANQTIEAISGGGTNGGNVSLATGALTIANASANTYSGVISGPGALNKQGAGTLTLAGDSVNTGVTTIGAGTLQLGNGTSGGSVGGDIVNNTALVYNFTNTVSYAKSISGPGTVTKNGGGILQFAGANSYTGSTFVNAGYLRVTSAQALGNTAGITVTNGALQLDGNGVSVGGFNLGIAGAGGNLGALQSVNGTNAWNTAITLNADQTRLGAQPGAALVINGPIDSGTNLFGAAFRSDVAGSVILNGAATYKGTSTLVVGTLSLGGNDRLPVTSPFVIGNSQNTGLAWFDLAGYNQTVAALTSAGTNLPIVITNSTTNLSMLTVTNSNVTNLFGGVLRGPLGLTKDGNGTLILSGTNLNTGNLLVHGGVLALGSAAIISNSAEIVVGANGWLNVSAVTNGFTVASAQTLTGLGQVVGSLTNDGTLAPGMPYGALTFSSNAVLNGTTFIQVNKDLATNSVLAVANNLTLGGTLVVSNLGSAPLVAGDTFQVFNAASLQGAFASLASPGPGLAWQVSPSGALAVIAAGPGLAIDVQPLDQTNYVGANVAFSVTASGSASLTYQWYQMPGTLLVGATNASLVLSNVQAADTMKQLQVVVSDGMNSVTSRVATLTVYQLLLAQPIYGGAGSGFSATVDALPGWSYWIEASSDLKLKDWVFVSGVTNVSGEQTLSDLSAEAPNRFYRLGARPPTR